MDNRYQSKVLAELSGLFEEQGFKNENGVFKNAKKAVKVNYDEPRQSYVLLVADIDEDGAESEFAELSSWLFDDSQTESDAESVGIDFADTLRKNMGIKVRTAAGAAVELPTAEKGSSVKIAGFAKKVLDVYPQFKDDYKEHIAKYGNFLYLNFFGETLVPQIKETMKQNNKKSRKKLFDMLENAYINGDKETVNTVVAVLAAAALNDEQIKTAIDDMLSENTHFKTSFDNFLPELASKKKLKEAFGIK